MAKRTLCNNLEREIGKSECGGNSNLEFFAFLARSPSG
jgi:hypothetical protein